MWVIFNYADSKVCYELMTSTWQGSERQESKQQEFKHTGMPLHQCAPLTMHVTCTDGLQQVDKAALHCDSTVQRFEPIILGMALGIPTALTLMPPPPFPPTPTCGMQLADKLCTDTECAKQGEVKTYGC